MSHIASSHADQPAHVAHQAVPLAALDLVYASRAGGEGQVFEVKPVRVRAAKMDPDGTGYEYEFYNKKWWDRSLLSREDFGIDNFRVEAEARHWGAFVHARAWFWRPDSLAAEAALREAAWKSIEQLHETVAAALRTMKATARSG